MYFKGKTAIITGGSGGIGGEIACSFASRGCNIFIVDLCEVPQELKEKLEGYGVKVSSYQCDVSDFDACKAAIDAAVEEFGAIEYLINNAGIVRDSMIKNMTEKQWDQIYSVDVKSCFNMTRHMWPVFEAQYEAAGKTGETGSIINMSSVTPYTANIGQSNYGSAKGAVSVFTMHTAREFAKIGVTANALAPGFIISAITDKLQGAARERYLNTIPLKRPGTVEEVARGAVFLAENRYITGQILHIDGGMVMHNG